ncbi:MAG TPA: glycosyltransferase family 9 protein [Verrucomicrobiae bacterium]|nr:glycosyltransferase family 9 protein [Verrucomicrobiae bacterium]
MSTLKPKLLIVELWGLGDLVIATPLLRAATKRFDVTLLAKPYALDLQRRLWPGVRVVPFVAPWTAFKNKYRLWQWPWREIIRLQNQLAGERFDFGVSARRVTNPPLSGDLRDHLLLKLFGIQNRIGFPFLRRRFFLTQPVAHPEPEAHRYESWRAVARALDIELPSPDEIPFPAGSRSGTILIHSGAGQPIRVWPLENYRRLAARLRANTIPVQIACDPEQRNWWLRAGEDSVATPSTVTELIALTDRAGAFIGNDSGPGHLAAFCGVPTFTIFGPQLPEWFAPLHPRAEWIEGKVCPFLPCSDYCRFPEPFCIRKLADDEVWDRIQKFLSIS